MRQIGDPAGQFNAGNRATLSREPGQGRQAVCEMGRARTALRTAAQPRRFRQAGSADAGIADHQSEMHGLQCRTECRSGHQAYGRCGESLRCMDRLTLGA